MGITTTDLISKIRLRGSFPASDTLFSNADYLSILDDEIRSVVVPLLSTINEEYWQDHEDMAIVSGTSNYRIPARAVGSMLRDVQLIDSANGITPLVRLFEEDRQHTSEGPLGYYLKGNQIVLSPSPTSSTETLRMVFMRRPSTFVLPTACAEVTVISGNDVTVASLPSSITTATPIDFVQACSPYDLLSRDVTISSIASTTLTFSSGDVPSGLVVGDYICLAGQTCVPMIPDDLVHMLVQAALCVCLTSKKDDSAKLELEKLEMMKQAALKLMSPRVKSDDIKIRNTNSLINAFRRR